MSTDTSHISHDGALRLKRAFTILKKYNVDLGPNFDDKNMYNGYKYEDYFGFSDKSKSTWWSLQIYHRHKMKKPEDTKENLINTVNVDNPKSLDRTSEFDFLVKNYKISRADYFSKRSGWNKPAPSKDRVIILDKFWDLVKYYVNQQSITNKINNLSRLIAAIDEMQEPKNPIWTGKNIGGTSINHLLNVLTRDLAFGVINYIKLHKIPSTGKLLENISSEINYFINILKVSIINKFKINKSDYFDGKSFGHRDLNKIEIYIVSQEEYNENVTENFKSLSDSKIYFKIIIIENPKSSLSPSFPVRGSNTSLNIQNNLLFFLKCDISEATPRIKKEYTEYFFYWLIET